MKKAIVTLLLALAMVGCSKQITSVVSVNLPPPIETSPVAKFQITGKLQSVVYYPKFDLEEAYNEERTVVVILTPNGAMVGIGFVGANVTQQFTGKSALTVVFTGSYSRATLVSVR